MAITNIVTAVADVFSVFNKNAARDNFYSYFLRFLSQRPEISYDQAQGYILAVDKFYTDLFNSKGKIEPTDETQYDNLMNEINKRVTENPAPIVPQPITVPGNVIADVTLPDYTDTLKKVEGYINLGLTIAAAGGIFYIFLKLKK